MLIHRSGVELCDGEDLRGDGLGVGNRRGDCAPTSASGLRRYRQRPSRRRCRGRSDDYRRPCGLDPGGVASRRGAIDAVVANAGGGPPETSLSLNFFGAVATLEGLRPLLANSPAPRAVAVSSIASLRSTPAEIIEKCLQMDELGAIAAARTAIERGRLGAGETDRLPDSAQTSLHFYGAAKQALQYWCRRVAPTEE